MRGIVLALVAAGCSADARQKPEISDKAKAAITAAGRMGKPGELETVVGAAVLERIVGKDASLTDAEVLKLLGPSSSTEYVKTFTDVSKLRRAELNFKTADGNRFGLVRRGPRSLLVTLSPCSAHCSSGSSTKPEPAGTHPTG